MPRKKPASPPRGRPPGSRDTTTRKNAIVRRLNIGLNQPAADALALLTWASGDSERHAIERLLIANSESPRPEIPARIFLLHRSTSTDGRGPAGYQSRTADINEAIAFARKYESCPYTSAMVRMITATESRVMNSEDLLKLTPNQPAP